MSAPQERLRHPDTNSMIPPAIIKAMIALALGSLLMVAWARLTDRPLVGVPLAAAVEQERTIRLIGHRDQPGMIVADAAGNPILTLDNGGFITAVHAALRHNRARHGLAPDLPIRLALYANGRLTAHDDLTGWSVELGSFGLDSRAAFARILDL